MKGLYVKIAFGRVIFIKEMEIEAQRLSSTNRFSLIRNEIFYKKYLSDYPMDIFEDLFHAATENGVMVAPNGPFHYFMPYKDQS